ncbi:MAG: polysaccharide deacetylase family protein [Chloroflexota bacterium]
MTQPPPTRRDFLRLLRAGAVGAGGLLMPGASRAEAAPAVECPIYFFHEVASGSSFARFIIDLLNRGGHPISVATLLASLGEGERGWPEGKRPFVITFDDGLASQRRNALPFLTDWAIPASFAVMPGFGDGRHQYLTDSNVREIAGLGFELVSHTMNHAALVRLRRANPGAWAAEIVDSKARLQDISGRPVDFFCYPFGSYDAATIDLVSQHYRGALSTRRGLTHSAEEAYLLRRERRS